MAPHAHAAAHREALQQADDRFGIFEDLRIQPVFVAPELPPIAQITALPGGVHIRNIAASAKRLIPVSIDEYQRHIRVAPRI